MAAFACLILVWRVRQNRQAHVAGQALSPVVAPGPGRRSQEPVYHTIEVGDVEQAAMTDVNSTYLAPVTHNRVKNNPVYSTSPPASDPEARYETVDFPEPAYADLDPGLHSTEAPRYDTVGFVRDQYAELGPHSTYDSADTEA